VLMIYHQLDMVCLSSLWLSSWLFSSTRDGRCSLIEPNGSRQESLREPRLYVCDSTTPSLLALVTWDVNLCIQI
jgi:hypothetical protein